MVKTPVKSRRKSSVKGRKSSVKPRRKSSIKNRRKSSAKPRRKSAVKNRRKSSVKPRRKVSKPNPKNFLKKSSKKSRVIPKHKKTSIVVKRSPLKKNVNFFRVINPLSRERELVLVRMNPSQIRSRPPTLRKTVEMHFSEPEYQFEVYTKDGCGYCDKAKKYLTKKGRKFRVIRGEENQALSIRMKNIGEEGYNTWPRIFRNGKFIGGYTDLVNLI